MARLTALPLHRFRDATIDPAPHRDVHRGSAGPVSKAFQVVREAFDIRGTWGVPLADREHSDAPSAYPTDAKVTLKTSSDGGIAV